MFVPFAVLYMGEPIKLDYLWAGLCLLGAVYFVFRSMTVVALSHFLRIYVAFAAGYLMSYLYRMVTAVISPELTRDLDLNPASLGLLTSTYLSPSRRCRFPWASCSTATVRAASSRCCSSSPRRRVRVRRIGRSAGSRSRAR